jgi:hypothetical protein
MFQLDRTKTIAVVMSWVGGALILASAILVTLDLVLRHLANATTSAGSLMPSRAVGR